MSLAMGILVAGTSLALGRGFKPKVPSGLLRKKAPKEDDYDRLDGRGPSRAKVDVIEWAGNLEIHVYPKGMLQGLSLHFDDGSDSGQAVMVIGYRFRTQYEKQLIRRAVLGIPMNSSFHTYIDRKVGSYDKIVISKSKLSNSLTAYRLEKPSKFLYPEGHPKRNIRLRKDKSKLAEQSDTPQRVPAQAPQKKQEEDIRHFSW